MLSHVCCNAEKTVRYQRLLIKPVGGSFLNIPTNHRFLWLPWRRRDMLRCNTKLATLKLSSDSSSFSDILGALRGPLFCDALEPTAASEAPILNGPNGTEAPMTRTVHCIKLGRDAEGLDVPPYPGDLGRRIFESVSKEAWQAWLKHQTMLVNENRLSLADPRARKYLAEQMEGHFFGSGADAVEGFVPPPS
jgi:Fe-S cluster biosynthesis and repair protein YggX